MEIIEVPWADYVAALRRKAFRRCADTPPAGRCGVVKQLSRLPHKQETTGANPVPAPNTFPSPLSPIQGA